VVITTTIAPPSSGRHGLTVPITPPRRIFVAMKLFGKTKMQQFESVLASLRKRAALLADKKITAQAVLDGAIAARQAHMIDGDLGDERLTVPSLSHRSP
jgi:hypothetical protein